MLVSGLKKELQAKLIPWQPQDMNKVVSLAKLFEEKQQMMKKGTLVKHIYNPNLKFKTLPSATPVPTLPNAGGSASQGTSSLVPFTPIPPQPVHQIGFEEMQVPKAKGLCFNCDEKFSPSHKCPNKRLLLLQWDKTQGDDSTKEFLIDPQPQPPDTLEDNLSKLSINTLYSTTTSGTIQFTGSIHGQPIKILLNGSFLLPKLVQFLHLDMHPTAPLSSTGGQRSDIDNGRPDSQLTNPSTGAYSGCACLCSSYCGC